MHRGLLNSLVRPTTSGNVSRKRKTTKDCETMSPPPPGFPVPLYSPESLTLLHLGQPGTPPPSQPLLPGFDTVLRLSVVPPPPPQQQGGGDDGMDLMTLSIKSFLSLMTGDGSTDDDAPPPPANLHLHKDSIDHALKCNREILEEMCAAVEENAAKKMKEKEEEILQLRAKNAELENMVATCQHRAMNMEEMLKPLEQTNATLSAALEKTTSGNVVPAQQAAGEEEDAESSSLDPDQVLAVRIICKRCWKEPASMMTWPCRHLCLCKGCERSIKVIKRCPVCYRAFRNCIEVKFY